MSSADVYLTSCFHPRGGGLSHWHGICICDCFFMCFFANFDVGIGGFSSQTKAPNQHKLGVFWANYRKKYPIWSKLGVILYEIGMLMGSKWQQK